ncbi:hypothetical protein QJS10_CPB12g01067 [Acorus calamus]|uniref:Uncharacterized protein n=1 Tax=Acorus calamus TaxID=4465 RepID=A0AAV9DL45_ACOCL|nr:hypothetical protein QJS10_CPB12g01067 [Acorus calamus]
MEGDRTGASASRINRLTSWGRWSTHKLAAMLELDMRSGSRRSRYGVIPLLRLAGTGSAAIESEGHASSEAATTHRTAVAVHVFASGQALGGQNRSHAIAASTSASPPVAGAGSSTKPLREPFSWSPLLRDVLRLDSNGVAKSNRLLKTSVYWRSLYFQFHFAHICHKGQVTPPTWAPREPQLGLWVRLRKARGSDLGLRLWDFNNTKEKINVKNKCLPRVYCSKWVLDADTVFSPCTMEEETMTSLYRVSDCSSTLEPLEGNN